MITKETPFTDLTKSENLQKIKIDKILIPYFVEVMGIMQSYFEKKGFLNANHYGMLFEKWFFDSKFGFKIKVSDLGDCSGLFDLKKNCIYINSDHFDGEINKLKIESALCHEFIHFLASCDEPFIEQKNGSFVQNSLRFADQALLQDVFLDEAYTEYITQKMFPSSCAYDEEIRMLKLFNYVYEVSDDKLFAFLRGQLPGVREDCPQLKSFKKNVETCENHFKIDSMANAAKDINYLMAIDDLMSIFEEDMQRKIMSHEFENVQDYANRISGLYEVLPIEMMVYSVNLVNDLNKLFVSSYASLYLSPEQEVEMQKDIENLVNLSYLLSNSSIRRYSFCQDDKVFRINYFCDNVVINLFGNDYKMSIDVEDEKEFFTFNDNNEKQHSVKFKLADRKLKIFVDEKLKDEQWLPDKVKFNILMADTRKEIEQINQKYHIFATDDKKILHKISCEDKSIYQIDKIEFPTNKDLLGEKKLFLSIDVYENRKVWIANGELSSFDLPKVRHKRFSTQNKELFEQNKNITHSIELDFSNGHKLVFTKDSNDMSKAFEMTEKDIKPLAIMSSTMLKIDTQLVLKQLSRTKLTLTLENEKIFER